MPIDAIDKGQPDISGDPKATQPLNPRQMLGAQKRQVNRTQLGTHPTGKGLSPGQANGKPEGKPEGDQGEPDAEAKGDVSIAQPQHVSAARQGFKATPEQQAYYAKVAQNPWMPGPVDFVEIPVDKSWAIVNHLGRAWNALLDPNAMAAAQHNIWQRQDAIGEFLQILESGGGPGAIAGVTEHQTRLRLGIPEPDGTTAASSEWFWENFGAMVLEAPMYLNPLSGAAAFGLSLAGQAPQDPKQIPAAVAGGLPLAEIGTVAKHPEEIKNPEVAARLFWKSANAALLGLSVLPLGRILRGLRIIDPKRLEELSQSAVKMKNLQPADASKLPSGEVLKEQLNLPLLPNRTLVVPAKQVEEFRMVRKPGETEYHDVTARLRKQLYDDLGIAAPSDLPHVAPNWTPAQVKLFRKTAQEFLGYDLERLTKEDVPPEDPSIFLEQLPDDLSSHGMNYFTALQHALLQTERGPAVDALNAAESMTQAIPATHGATEYIMNEYYTWARQLVEAGKLDERAMMKAMRDDATYQALPPAAKLIVNAEKMLGRAYMRQAMAFGHRDTFVTNYDPRVKVDEEATGKGGASKKALTSETKAHRQETVIPDPQDEERVVLTEKDEDVFALNKRMQAARDAFIATETMSNRQRLLEEAALKARDDLPGAMRAARTLSEMEGKWPAPSSEVVAQAKLRASRLYPLFHEKLLDASFLSRTKQIKALHSHIASQQALNALAHDGRPLAFLRGAREIPGDYRALENASKAFDGMVFHPDFAGPLNRIAKNIDLPGYAQAWVKLNQISVLSLMFSPMIHGDNIAGRVLWLMSKNPVRGAPEAAQSMSHSWIANHGPWVALEKMLGFSPKTDEERYAWQLSREMEAIRAGVIPHFPSRGIGNLLWSEYGKATGDQTGFERPGTAENYRLPPAFHGIEGAARKVGHGYDWMQNLLWGKIVWPSGVFAFHVERAAAKAAHPELPDLVIDQMAAHQANRWQGAIEPMARSQAMNTIYRSAGFAVNWVRSFYELALPSYLAKSAVAAHPALRGYILRQELQSLIGMMMAQQISGNVLNFITSGHPQWENDPHNRYYLEVTRPEIIRGLQKLGLYKNINAETGRDPSTGGKLVEENFLARQQLQNERMLGLEPGTTSMQGLQDMAAGHLAPLVDTLAAAFNLDLPQTLLAGTPRWIDGHKGPEYPWQSNFLATVAQFAGVSSTLGSQVKYDASGRPIRPSTWPPWLAAAPVPDVVKRYAAPAAQQTWNWLTGVRAPYVRVEKTEGQPIPDQNYAKYDELQTAYKADMTKWSNDLYHGKMTPHDWVDKYRVRSHDYAIRLDNIFGGAAEYKNGSLGLYAQYQALYNQAELPDGTGMDWAKLDGLQAEFNSKLTAAQKSDLQTEIGKHENAYPALGLYRSTIDAHVAFTKKWANENGISYGRLMADLDGSRGLDTTQFQQFESKHPELRRYYAAQTEWEINTWAGRQYSLYYHTSAMARWLIPMEGADTPATEEAAETVIQQHYHAPAASGA